MLDVECECLGFFPNAVLNPWLGTFMEEILDQIGNNLQAAD